MSDAETAAAQLFERASIDIAGSIAELIAAKSERGENVDLQSVTVEMIGTLLGSAWKLAIFNAGDDRAEAARLYGAMLDAHRIAVEKCATNRPKP